MNLRPTVWLPDERKIVISRDLRFLNEFDGDSPYEDIISDNILYKQDTVVTEAMSNPVQVEFAISNQQLESSDPQVIPQVPAFLPLAVNHAIPSQAPATIPLVNNDAPVRAVPEPQSIRTSG